jgi:hypothetical protein
MCNEFPYPFEQPRCEECGSILDMEMESDGVLCVDCLAEAANFQMPDSPSIHLFTAHQIDVLCGVTHRRKTA